jgi:hypothetical protein
VLAGVRERVPENGEGGPDMKVIFNDDLVEFSFSPADLALVIFVLFLIVLTGVCAAIVLSRGII